MEYILGEEEASNQKEKEGKNVILHHESKLKKQEVTKIWLIRKIESNLNKKKAEVRKELEQKKIHYEKYSQESQLSVS